MICHYRHGDCYNILYQLKPNKDFEIIEEGFLTSNGRFINRIIAKEIAEKANQLIRESPFKELITEDLY